MRNAEKFTQIFLAGAVVAVLTTGFDKGIVRVVATTPRTTTSDTVPAPTSLKEAEGATTRVSVASDGTEGNGNSQLSRIPPSISADGRFVTFISEASNLVSGDTNGQNDIFVHDSKTVRPRGSPSPRMEQKGTSVPGIPLSPLTADM